ncbi:MAG TPA: hypothetical protein VFB59_02565 [Candidatus Saccharimonadales bacterium]|nr:hypothetical protein [Candidatus Saccharimonadales bacterium]
MNIGYNEGCLKKADASTLEVDCTYTCQFSPHNIGRCLRSMVVIEQWWGSQALTVAPSETRKCADERKMIRVEPSDGPDTGAPKVLDQYL